MGSGQLSMYSIIVSLCFARGLKFDDVKRALSYFASPFLARLLFVRVMQLSKLCDTDTNKYIYQLYLCQNSV